MASGRKAWRTASVTFRPACLNAIVETPTSWSAPSATPQNAGFPSRASAPSIIARPPPRHTAHPATTDSPAPAHPGEEARGERPVPALAGDIVDPVARSYHLAHEQAHPAIGRRDTGD